MVPNPGVLDQLIRERQEQLQRSQRSVWTQTPSGLRVRIGHALIAVGSSLSGERVEVPARPPAHSRAAA